MLYISRDERDPNNHIHYYRAVSRFGRPPFHDKRGFFRTIRLYDPLINKYRRERVFLRPDKIEFSKNKIYKITKWEEGK